MHATKTEPVNDMATLAEDARALLHATADLAGDKIQEARQRLATVLDEGRDIAERVREKAGEGAEAAEDAVLHHPYQAIAIAFGIGALLGFLAVRRKP